MNKQMCERFKNVREWISDESKDKENYKINDDKFLNDYCDNKQCQNDFDLISAGCLYLLDQLYKNSGVLPSPSKSNPYIVDYILIWLSYMLNLTNSEEKDNITVFYNNYINSCSKYNTEISELNEHDHDNYKDLIDKRKEFLDKNSNIVSKFYEAFKLLCNLYNELDYEKNNCKNYLDDNSDFFKKYQELKQDTRITGNNSYNKLLSTLSTDYDDFKKECKDILSFLSKETEQKSRQTLLNSFGDDSEYNIGEYVDDSGQDVHNSDVASSSSSIVSKLIPVLLIFGAIAFFLGISYKYSLFGFRKRSPKQHLREKLKK
ncbi:PIR protein [Plasmodium yoelii]|uniref:PIR protein n=2 Tax=Plasmodium yoelii TaxID=5861 RepID=A0AAE9WWY5_PLAYO|nr:PIR protein [Plasmodium yoelii]WBY60501.1 PIR protein [Plasmodium yoelii yoelii]VTZ81108.1 PIR protein [Plasmodium yoelii]|eukprot:XP_022813795.1 PIR protein [Plasmodium yoelii]